MQDATYRKVRARVVLPLAALIVLSSIDRVNVSFAAIRMNADIGLDPRTYGLGVGIFFAGYLLFQLPSAAILQRIGARAWIAASVIGWGAAAAAMGAIQTPLHFYIVRFLLGLFESGFAPGVVWYVSIWLPQAYRARTIAVTMLAIPTSVVVGGPLCGMLMSIETDGIAAWRLMFVAEGAATVLAGIAAWFWFVDGPARAPWLTAAERDGIAAALTADRAAAGRRDPVSMRAIGRDPILWLSAALWFVLITGANAIIFWLPITIRALGRADPLEIGVLSALPWIAIGAGMILNARHSDRSGERYAHLGLPTLLAAVMLVAAALAIERGPVALGLLMLAGLGLGAAQSVFWTIPTRFVGARNPAAIATINLFGNASGTVAPVVIGWIVATTGSVAVPGYVLAALLLGGALLVLPLRRAGMAREVST